MKNLVNISLALFVVGLVSCHQAELPSSATLATPKANTTEPRADISDITIASRIMPVDVAGGATYDDWIKFGWDSFIALNWPSASNWPLPNDQAGEPSEKLLITDRDADSKPVVWQTYLVPGQVFRPGGADPGDWLDPKLDYTTNEGLPLLGGFEEKAIYFLTQNPEIGLALFDLAITPNPVVDQNGNYVLLESRLNQSEFEYFKSTKYYDAENQKNACQDGTFEMMPTTGVAPGLPEWAKQGAVELKISWKILDDSKDIKSRYFKTTGYFQQPDGTRSGPHTFGLVGLHILRNTPTSKTTWFWTTFEQVDNVAIQDQEVPPRLDGNPLTPSFNPGPAGEEPQYQFGYDMEGRFDAKLLELPTPHPSGDEYVSPVTQPATLRIGDPLPANPRPVNCSRVTRIPDAVRALNQAYQQKLQGTVWQYYEMIDVLYPKEDGIAEVLTPSRDPEKSHHHPRRYVNTPALVNVTLESYLAYKPSNWNLDNCLSCHYDAQPILPEGMKMGEAPQVFSYLYRRATSSVAKGDGE